MVVMQAEPSAARRGADGGCDASGQLRLVRAAELSARQLDQLRVVYQQAFPARLRVPLATLAAPAPRDQLLVALADAEPVGFAACRLLPRASWVFLRYFGVAADRRRQRLGIRAWRQLQRAVADSGWPARIAFEVEDPAEVAGDAAERQNRQDRIAFWRNCGAEILPVAGYVMPALTELGEPEPMILMAADPDREVPLAAADLAVLVRAIYTEHYQFAGQDPLVAAAVASVGRDSE